MTVTDDPTREAGVNADPLGPVGGAAARLLEVVAELLATPAVELDPTSSLLRTEAVLAARVMLRAVELGGVADADTRELYALRQAGSVGTWLGGIACAAGGGNRLAVARRLGRSPAARAALVSAALAPVAVERILTAVDALPDRLVDTITAGLTGVHETPAGRQVDPGEAADAAARYTALLSDGLRELIGVQPEAVTAQVEAALTALTAETPRSALEVTEQLTSGLVLLARHLHPTHLRSGMAVLLEALTPPPPLADGDPQWDARHLHLSDLLDGWGRIDGELPPEVYRLLRARLEACVRDARGRTTAQQEAETAGAAADPLLPLPRDPAAADHGAAPPKPGRRPTGREYADALADLLRGGEPDHDPAHPTADHEPAADQAADHEPADDQEADDQEGHHQPADHQPAQDVPVDVDHAAVAVAPTPAPRPVPRRSPRRSWAPVTPVAIVVPAGRLTRRAGALAARTADGHRVSDARLHQALCHAGLTAYLTDPRSLDLDAAASQRAANAAQRAALTAVWGGRCATHGCGRPGTIPHHVLPWHLHGRTIMNNLRPLCHGCHDDLHLGARTLRLRDGTAIGPTGWVHPPPDLPPDHPLPDR